MKKNFVLFVALFLIIGTVLFFSCRKEDASKLAHTEFDRSYALPVAHTYLTVKDIIKADSVKGTVDNQLFTLIQQDTFYSAVGNDLMAIPVSSTSPVINLSATDITQFISAGTFSSQKKDTVVFNFSGGAEIKTIDVLTGNMVINGSSQVMHNVKVAVSIPALKQGSVTFQDTLTMNYSGSSPVKDSIVLNLAGYSMNLGAGGTNNRLPVNLNATFTYINANSILPSDQVSININFTNLKFSYIEGYLGQFTTGTIAQSMNVDVFRNALSGGLNVFDPRLDVVIKNSCGLPITGNFNPFNAVSSTGGTTPFTSTLLPITFNFPALGQTTKTTTVNFDTLNSNIRSVINSSPKDLTYTVNAATNPAGNTTINFLNDKSNFEVDIQLTLPLKGTVNALVLQDTISTDLSIFDDNQPVTFQLWANNSFPLYADLQIFFLGSTGNMIDSLLISGNNTIKSANVNINGAVLDYVKSTITASLTASRFSLIRNGANKIVIRSTFRSKDTGNKTVSIFGKQDIEILLGVQAKMKL